MKRKLVLDATQIRPLATNRGGCIATAMITVEGDEVGYMRRDEPRNRSDSGWQFLSGRESQAYLDDADNSAVHDVNTIANCDPEVVSYLDAPPGAAFERRGRGGKFVQVEGEPWEPGAPSASREGGWPPPRFPLVDGEYALTPSWSIHLPEPFARRVEDESLVLWRPGLTLWLSSWGNDSGESAATRLEAFKKAASNARYAEREVVAPRVTRFDYRLREESDDGPVDALYAVILSDAGQLQLAVYFDDPADEDKARRLVDSVGARSPDHLQTSEQLDERQA